MTQYVVDASIAARWFFNEPYAEASRRLLTREFELHAPDFFLLEMDNLFWKRVRRGEITPADAMDARRVLGQCPIEYHSFIALREAAYALAAQTGRSMYDSLYLSLAIVLDAAMITADRRLCNALANSIFAKHILWIGDAIEA